MALNIKNQEVEQLVSEIAELSGESKTNTVKKALMASKAQLSRDVSRTERIRSFARYLEEEIWASVPESELGVRISKNEREAILGYGPEGA